MRVQFQTDELMPSEMAHLLNAEGKVEGSLERETQLKYHVYFEDSDSTIVFQKTRVWGFEEIEEN